MSISADPQTHFHDIHGRNIVLGSMSDAPELALRLAQITAKSATITFDAAVWRTIPVDFGKWFSVSKDESAVLQWMANKSNELLQDVRMGDWLISSPGETFLPYRYFDGRTGAVPTHEALAAVFRFEHEIFPRWRKELLSLGMTPSIIDAMLVSHGVLAGQLQLTVVRQNDGRWASKWDGDLYINAKVSRSLLGDHDSPWLTLNAEAHKKCPWLSSDSTAIEARDSDAPDITFDHYCIPKGCLELLTNAPR